MALRVQKRFFFSPFPFFHFTNLQPQLISVSNNSFELFYKVVELIFGIFQSITMSYTVKKFNRGTLTYTKGFSFVFPSTGKTFANRDDQTAQNCWQSSKSSCLGQWSNRYHQALLCKLFWLTVCSWASTWDTAAEIFLTDFTLSTLWKKRKRIWSYRKTLTFWTCGLCGLQKETYCCEAMHNLNLYLMNTFKRNKFANTKVK